uniref:AB hydrolase-1 domain-containing protein n=1 Tax=Steinernema glaseri TaxID=37863 RepID=A0A1I8ACB6_9BILA
MRPRSHQLVQFTEDISKRMLYANKHLRTAAAYYAVALVIQDGQHNGFSSRVAGGRGCSHSCARADEAGAIDLARDAPIRGSYRDVEPMGLFMSMGPVGDYRIGSPIIAVPTSRPFLYMLKISDSDETTVAEVEIERVFEHGNVERIEIENETVTGTLYKPKEAMYIVYLYFPLNFNYIVTATSGKLPAIIDLYGSSGGIKEHRAALLASHGFAVLCLPYFGYKNLPDKLRDVDLDYFQNAVEFFCSQPYTTDRCGVIGTSLGGALACLLAIRNPKVKAVVSINGPPVLDVVVEMLEHGVPLPVVHYEQLNEMRLKNGIPMYKSIVETLPYDPDMVFPIERSARDTKFYFIASIDDDSHCAVAAAKVLCDRLRKSGHWHDMDIVWGGHLIDPCYIPLVDVIYNKHFGLLNMFGGEPWRSAVCQRHTWHKTIDFFSSHIGKPVKMVPLSEVRAKI